jgi:erythromycin esterase-like protein
MTSLEDTGWDLADDHAITRFLDSLPARPLMLGLGEPTHGEEEFLRLRNRLFQHLVAHEGYRMMALESDCLAGLAVDSYVRDGAGSLDEAMRDGFSHGFGASPANRELVQWMRERNRDRPPAQRLRFFGFDAPLEMMSAASPRRALVALHRYLASNVDVPHDIETIERLIGDDARWANEDVAMNPSLGVGATGDAIRLRLIADDLHALLGAEAPHLIATTPPDEWWRANLHARTAVGLLRYHADMADPSPARVSRLLGLRDAMMADNLSSIVDTGPVLVFANNRHLQRERSHWQLAGMALRWWSAGAHMSARLGDGYAFVATAVGTAPHLGLDEPTHDTLEGVMSGLPGERYLVDTRRLAAAVDLSRLRPRESANPGYFPLDPEHVARADGIAFIKG